jgi:hypothetical protein
MKGRKERNKVIAGSLLTLMMAFVFCNLTNISVNALEPLVGFWHFDEGSGKNTYDSSTYANDGILLPQTAALGFDGVNDYVKALDSNSLRLSNNIALEAWIYPTNLTAGVYQVILHKNNHTLNYRSYYLGLLGDKLTFYLSTDGLTNYMLTSATSITVNAWTHVAATSDGTTMRLYINGTADSNTLAGPATIYTSPADVIIGAYLIDTSGYQRPFNGTIDEVRISNIARTTFNLTDQPVVDANTVALWHFNEETGTTAYDETSNDNDGAITGATWVAVGPIAGPAWTTSGKYNGALMFDGANDYVEVPDSDSLDITGEITLEAWVYPRSLDSRQVIICKYNHTTLSSSYYLGIGGTLGSVTYMNKFYYALTYDGNHYYAMVSTANITADTWTHVTATMNGTHMILYINGEYDAARTYPPGTIYAGTAALRIGCYLPEAGYPRVFNGTIDEVAVFNDIRSLHDIAIASISPSKTVVGEGMNSSIRIDARVENNGEYPETFSVSLCYNSNLIENLTISDLESGSFLILTFDWNTTGIVRGNYTLSAAATPIFEEMDKNNNCADRWVLITIAGDVTGAAGSPDGRVDMRDIALFCMHFMRTPSHPEWDPNMDINDDDIVNMRDIDVVCDNFLE